MRLWSHSIQMNHPTWMGSFHYRDCFPFLIGRLYSALKESTIFTFSNVMINTRHSDWIETEILNYEIYLRATEINVTPHPMLQHQPTKHNRTVTNWQIPTTRLRKNEQNLRSQLSPWKSGECLVNPQQQKAHKNPLRIVPEQNSIKI